MSTPEQANPQVETEEIIADAVTQVEADQELQRNKYEPPLLAGKYKSVTELERAYNEAHSLIGQQGRELSELRQEVDEEPDEEYEDSSEPYQAEPQYQQPAFDEDAYDDLLAEGSAEQAAIAALRAGRHDMYEDAIEDLWSEDPRSAARLERQVESWAAGQQQAVQQQTVNALEVVHRNFAAQHSDFAQYEQRMSELAANDPGLLAGLEQGAEGAQKVLGRLYNLAKAEQPGQTIPHVTSGTSAYPSGGGEKRDPLHSFVEQAISRADRVKELR